MDTQQLIQACKTRADDDYDTFHMFVECYDDDEWIEFVTDEEDAPMTKKECFRIMDVVAEVWADHQAEADQYKE